MHEYAFMQEVIASALARLSQENPPPRVSEVILKVGGLEVHSEAAARLAFKVQVRGTPLEGCRLNLTLIPPKWECHACGAAGVLDQKTYPETSPLIMCSGCGKPVVLQGGRGVETLELILEE